MEDCELTDDKRQRRTGVIAKLVGARCEVEDVLLSAGGSTNMHQAVWSLRNCSGYKSVK